MSEQRGKFAAWKNGADQMLDQWERSLPFWKPYVVFFKGQDFGVYACVGRPEGRGQIELGYFTGAENGYHAARFTAAVVVDYSDPIGAILEGMNNNDGARLALDKVREIIGGKG